MIVVAVAILFLGACAPPGAVSRVDEALGTLDTGARAAQLVWVAVTPTAANLDSILGAVQAAAAPPGALWIEGGEADAIRELATALRARPGIPILLGVDVDEGLGGAIDGATSLPPLWRILLAGDEDTARAAGELIAAEAAWLGIDVGYVRGPPTIGGADYATADVPSLSERTAAFVEASADAGLPLVLGLFWSPRAEPEPARWDLARLAAVEIPTLTAAAPHVLGLLPGWLSLPALSGDMTRLPLSPAAHHVFRNELGWDAAILADLRDRDETEIDLLSTAIAAGADAVIVRSGSAAAGGSSRVTVPANRIDGSARRILAMKLDLDRAVAGAEPLPPRPSTSRSEALAATLETLISGAPATSTLPDAGAGVGGPYALRVVDPAEVGMSEADLVEVDEAILQAIEDSVFTAAAVAIGRRGGLVRFRGYQAEDAGIEVDPARSLFDMASLTKVVGTTTAAAILIEDGRLELDAPVARYIDRYDDDEKENVTIRHLLTHTSGLPPGLFLFGRSASAEEALDLVLDQPLRRPPGERVEYSDLGLIILAEIVERAAGMPIDRFLAARLFTPLDMSSTMYLPPLAFRDDVVPTAIETERPFVLRGVVHDGNAFRLGGTAGHAGMFSTARDLSIFVQMLLNGGVHRSARILDPGTVELLGTAQAEQRAIGWDTPADRSSAGRFFSSRSFGHTGYTGTSIWIDPMRELFVVLLTNRTYTEASAGEILDLRIEVHEAAVRAISDIEVSRRPGSR